MLEACTIVARNYLPHARTLAESILAVHPETRVTTLVIDRDGDRGPADQGRFRTLGLVDVEPDEEERRRLALIYDVTELATAVKPLLLQRLLSEGAQSVLFFDPDVQVFRPIPDLWRLAEEHGIALTPHILAPLPDDGLEPSGPSLLRAGAFNLGFIGVGRAAAPFLQWWSARLRRHCLSDPATGMFVDQRWLDYVPALFPHVVVRDPGCNVAYWNLHERPLSRSAEGLRVGGVPLRFFHFSGFDPGTPYLLSRHQAERPRALLSEQPVLRELCDTYAARLRAHGSGESAAPYGHSSLPDGTPIDLPMRRIFRSALLEAERRGAPPPPWPWGWDDPLQWFNAPSPEAPRLSRYLFGLYQQRPDIQREFPRPYGAHALAYLHWARLDPRAKEAIPAALRPGEGAEDPPPAGRGAAGGDGLNVVGYFDAELGVGEVARLVTRAARGGGIPVAAHRNGRTLSRQEDGFPVDASGGPYEVTLVCANADETPRVIDALPPWMRTDRRLIGFWFWETEELPERYRCAADELHEIWTASDFVAGAVRRAVGKPVHVCPLPLRLPEEVVVSRDALGLPEGFLFLFVFDFLSRVERKNPIGLIEAFSRAFRPGEGPTLVLKSINGPLAPGAFEAVRAAASGRPDVLVRDAYLPSRERDALMNACDCYVSLHRAEGFGLTLAEAMALGKPTIATGYSGNLAFMSPDNSFLVSCAPGRVPPGCEPYPQGDLWGEPDLAEAAALMRFVYENPRLARERGGRARAHVLERFSPERAVAFIRERLAALRTEGTIGGPAEGAAASAGGSEAVTGPASPATSESNPTAALVAAPEPPRGPDSPGEPLEDQLERAVRSVMEAERMLESGIPFRTPSRFGWPGQVLRTAVLRLLRPYEHFAARAHRHHLQATRRVLEALRGAASAPDPAADGKDGRNVPSSSPCETGRRATPSGRS